ncbi:MAG: translation initiation factor IF-2 subunit gamma [Candidatus Thermoplasmatota archaeon]|nr:translation initiation factor IF-2 subunit gamma [Candidatus Thermoplasmatota archaeon]
MTKGPQAEINIGMVGHVDHGKTTLTQALTGKWTDQHSEEMKRGISIKLGYADADFYRISMKKGREYYTSEPDRKEYKGGKLEHLRTVSFVDAPGHETLMAVMLSGAAIMDAAILIIAANEKCPQPQTREHLSALEVMGFDKFIVVQNKIDVCSRERAMESYEEIKQFLKGSRLENSPIIPVSAHHNRNIDLLIQTIEYTFPTPQKDLKNDFQMNVARSFDINKPGTFPKNIKGGVLGGTISSGQIKIGDKLEIRPGRNTKKGLEPINAKVESLHSGIARKNLGPGGLVAIGTSLDPSITKSDALLGNVIGKPGSLPPVWERLKVKATLLDRVVGTKNIQDVEELKTKEPLVITAGTRTTVGIPVTVKGNTVDMKLSIPVCAPVGQRIALSRQVDGKWHLIGYGIIN